jgi:hypothetical protein
MCYGYFSELPLEIQAHIPDLVETSGRIFFVGGLHLIFRTFSCFLFSLYFDTMQFGQRKFGYY